MASQIVDNKVSRGVTRRYWRACRRKDEIEMAGNSVPEDVVKAMLLNHAILKKAYDNLPRKVA
jgi:hypothetical protein